MIKAEAKSKEEEMLLTEVKIYADRILSVFKTKNHPMKIHYYYRKTGFIMPVLSF